MATAKKKSAKPASSATTDKVEEMPPDVAKAKAQLEAKTGKKYRYQKAKREMPSIPHMLAHGAPESEGKPKTWFDLFAFPAALAIAFAVSFLIFIHIPFDYSKKKFTLPKAQRKFQPKKVEPVPVVEKDEF